MNLEISFILWGDSRRISKNSGLYIGWDLNAEGTLKAKQYHHRLLLIGTYISKL